MRQLSLGSAQALPGKSPDAEPSSPFNISAQNVAPVCLRGLWVLLWVSGDPVSKEAPMGWTPAVTQQSFPPSLTSSAHESISGVLRSLHILLRDDEFALRAHQIFLVTEMSSLLPKPAKSQFEYR